MSIFAPLLALLPCIQKSINSSLEAMLFIEYKDEKETKIMTTTTMMAISRTIFFPSKEQLQFATVDRSQMLCGSFYVILI